MRENEALEILESLKVILTGSHFVYASGKHGSAYVEKRILYRHTRATSRIAEIMAEGFRGWGIDVVVGPEKGGIILAQWVAHHLSTAGHEALAINAEKNERILQTANDKDTFNAIGTGSVNLRVVGGEIIHRTSGFSIKHADVPCVRGKRVLVVEDIVNSGRSLRAAIEAVTRAGGIVIGTRCLFNRGTFTADMLYDLKVPAFMPVLDMTLDQWEEADCPLCHAGILVEQSIGHGREFLERPALRGVA